MTPRQRQRPKPRINWFAVAGLILNVSLMLLNGIIAYSAFNTDNLKRLNRIEDRVDILWSDWREERRHERAGRVGND